MQEWESRMALRTALREELNSISERLMQNLLRYPLEAQAKSLFIVEIMDWENSWMANELAISQNAIREGCRDAVQANMRKAGC